MPHLASRFLSSRRILPLIGSAISRLSMPTCPTLTYVYQPRLSQMGLHELFNHTFPFFRVCKALVFCLSWLEGDPQRCLPAHVRTLGEKHILFRQLIHKTCDCFVGGSGVCSAIKQRNCSLPTKLSLASVIYWGAGCIHAAARRSEPCSEWNQTPAGLARHLLGQNGWIHSRLCRLLGCSTYPSTAVRYQQLCYSQVMIEGRDGVEHVWPG